MVVTAGCVLCESARNRRRSSINACPFVGNPFSTRGTSRCSTAFVSGSLRHGRRGSCRGNAQPDAELSNQLHKDALSSRELIRIVDCLHAIGVEFLPYKGLALAEAVYGDIALRQSGDIDLLIRSAGSVHGFARPCWISDTRHTRRFPRLKNRLTCKSGYECAFDSAAGRNLLEVQWSIQPRFYAVDYRHGGLVQAGRTHRPLPAAGCKTPSLEDLFLVLSLHAAKHVWGRLIWLCDLARIMNLPGLNWNWIGSEADETGSRAHLARDACFLPSRLLGATIPAAAEN